MTTAVANRRFAERAVEPIQPEGEALVGSEGETLVGSLWTNGRTLYQVDDVESSGLVTLLNIDTGMPKGSLSIPRNDLPKLLQQVKGWILYTG
jgi:hypothetical protein